MRMPFKLAIALFAVVSSCGSLTEKSAWVQEPDSVV